tara:strand:- start:83 stop:493 length:411 start_codon:yes stop_codon:yes gene_type:complete
MWDQGVVGRKRKRKRERETERGLSFWIFGFLKMTKSKMNFNLHSTLNTQHSTHLIHRLAMNNVQQNVQRKVLGRIVDPGGAESLGVVVLDLDEAEQDRGKVGLANPIRPLADPGNVLEKAAAPPGSFGLAVAEDAG